MQYVVVVIMCFSVFAICFAGMALGLVVRGRILRGGCGTGLRDRNGKELSCEQCSKRVTNLCEEEDEMGLSGVSMAGTFGRFDKKKR